MRKRMKYIKKMSKFELQLFIVSHKSNKGRIKPFEKILNRDYSEKDRLLASQITYAQNRLRTM